MRKIHEIGLFRLALGIYLLYYQIIILKNFSSYFGPGSMIVPSLLVLKLSPLFWMWNEWILKIIFIVMMLLTLKLASGRISRRSLIVLYVLQVSFYQANPLIIHEPQQLANLFLLTFFLIRIDYPPLFFPSGKEILENLDEKNDMRIMNVLIVFLGIYYFLAGIKKLPDPLWQKGEALYYILHWPMIGKENFIVQFFLQHAFILKTLNYFALAYEILFVIFIFTRWRWVLILVGIGYHLGIYFTMDVGSFSPIMLVWLTLLVDQRVIMKLKNILPKKLKWESV